MTGSDRVWSIRVRLGRVAAESAQGPRCALCRQESQFAAEFVVDYPEPGLSICGPCSTALASLWQFLGAARGQPVQLSLLVEPQTLGVSP